MGHALLTILDFTDFRVVFLELLADLQMGHADGERSGNQLFDRVEVVAL